MNRFLLIGAIACRIAKVSVAIWIPVGPSSGLSPGGCMVTHVARVWINRVRLPVLHVRAQLNKKNEYFPVRVRA